MMETRTTKTVEFRAKFQINHHDPKLTKAQSISSKINSKSISKQKHKGTVFCFKRKN